MTLAIRQVMAQLAQLHDAYCTAILLDRDVEAALAVVAPHCTVVNLPMATGAQGTADLRRFLTEDVVRHLPGT